jgi:hypothetical protein
MKLPVVGKIGLLVAALLFLAAPLTAFAQEEQTDNPPPIEQPLLREGSLAVQLVSALGLQGTNDEVTAETLLGNAGISPRNGWIADYPVTPDIVGELRQSISDAADAGRIPLGRDEALNKLGAVIASMGVSVNPYTGDENSGELPENDEYYPSPTVINNYYYDEGPPIVTYYTPPADFYYLYSWIPYPFWCGAFWFPGFFVLNDFQRTIFVGHRHFFISNHFNDRRINRVFRVDPHARFNGRTYAGIGVSHRRGFVSTGVRGGERTIFNSSRMRPVPGISPTQRSGSFARHERRGKGEFSSHSRGTVNPTRSFTRPAGRNLPSSRNSATPPRSFATPQRSFNTPARGYTAPSRNFSPPPRSFTTPPRSFTPPPRSSSPAPRSFSSSPAGRGESSPSSQGGGGFSGGIHRR